LSYGAILRGANIGCGDQRAKRWKQGARSKGQGDHHCPKNYKFLRL